MNKNCNFDRMHPKKKQGVNGSKRPDFEITRSDGDESIIIIEAKKLFNPRSDYNKYGNKEKIQRYSDDDMLDIKSMLSQQLTQLRAYCILSKLNSICGIMTNFKSWIFTRYDLKQELQNEDEQLQMKKDKYKNPFPYDLSKYEDGKRMLKEKKECFEYSQTFDILNIDAGKQEFKLKYKEVAEIFYIIGNMPQAYAVLPEADEEVNNNNIIRF